MNEIARITLTPRIVHTQAITDLLFDMGVQDLQISRARSISHNVKWGRREENLISVIRFYCTSGLEYPLLENLAGRINFSNPAAGFLYSESLKISGTASLFHTPGETDGSAGTADIADFAIVQVAVNRGTVASLLSGVSALPGVQIFSEFGSGRGLRDRLGLLRVAIPADKETVTLAVPAAIEAEIVRKLIHSGRLDEPGRGFLSVHPARVLVPATGLSKADAGRVSGKHRTLKRMSSLWKKFGADKDMITGMTNCIIVCNEGESEDLIKKAMKSGVQGGIYSKTRELRNGSPVLHAREMCNMAIPEEQVADIVGLFRNSGNTDSDQDILIHPLSKAFTFRKSSAGNR